MVESPGFLATPSTIPERILKPFAFAYSGPGMVSNVVSAGHGPRTGGQVVSRHLRAVARACQSGVRRNGPGGHGGAPEQPLRRGKSKVKKRYDLWADAYKAMAAGALGGMVQGVILWLFGQLGLFIVVRLPLVPPLDPPFLYQRMVWGGIWGLFFLLPIMGHWSHLRRGWLMGLLPAAGSLFYFLPIKDGHGVMGLNLGGAMPFVVIFFGWVWGWLAGWFLDHAHPPSDNA